MKAIKKTVTIVASFIIVGVIIVVLSLFKVPQKASSTGELTFVKKYHETGDVCYVDKLRASGKYQILDIPETEKFSKAGEDKPVTYTVIGITDEAFQGEAQLEEIIIPSTITSIGKNAFSGCTGITKVTFHGTKEEWEKIYIQDGNECLTDAAITFE